jgi:DNA-binding CsgD family transcriptional regulator
LIESLTDRELQVFELIGQDFAPREISEALRLSVKTIEIYRDHIKKKVGAENASQLTRHAILWFRENRIA